jgi:Ulp1 family protease
MSLSSTQEFILSSLLKDNQSHQNVRAGWFSSPLDELKLQEVFLSVDKNNDDPDNLEATSIVIDKFGIPMTRKKFSCLKPGVWLNDEVINFYSNILLEHNNSQRHSKKKYHYLNTNFYAMLTLNYSLNFLNGDAFVRSIDVFSKKKLFIPINIANTHWVLVVVNIQEKTIHYYDSLYAKGNGSLFCGNILKWIEHLAHKKKVVYDEREWRIFEGAKGIPQQNNGNDCGVFVLMYMEFLSLDVSLLELHCSEMENWRKKVALTIISGSLLLSQVNKRSRMLNLGDELVWPEPEMISAANELLHFKQHPMNTVIEIDI